MADRPNLKYLPKRLAWRVPAIVVLWLVPHVFSMSGYPLEEDIAKPYREACIGALVIAFGAWFSTQGRRQKRDDQP